MGDVIMTEEILLKAVVLTFLAIGTYFDLRFKKIPFYLILAFITAGVIYVVWVGDYMNFMRYMGVLTGVCFCVISILSRQAVGMGDALMFLVLGWCLGFYQLLLLLFFSFCLSAVCSLILLAMKRVDKKTEIPFLPFLYLVFGGMCYL